MEAACYRTAKHLHFQSPRISYTFMALILELSFYSKDPDGVGDAINVFLFPDILP